MRGRDKKRSNR